VAAKQRNHTGEEEDDDDKKVYKTKKVLFIDSHGVKSFPYRGRRTHFSSTTNIFIYNLARDYLKMKAIEKI
jgi:hypothetical protein